MSVGKVLSDGENNQFPYKADKNGHCSMLLKIGELYYCSVYETRPTICRVDEMYRKNIHIASNIKDYYKITESICRDLMKINLMLNDNEIDLKYDQHKRNLCNQVSKC